MLGKVCSMEHHKEAGPRNTMDWEIFPEGLRLTLLKLKPYRCPIFVTENGVCSDDDAVRCRFIEQHLAETRKAMRMGVPVIGYLYWSLLDNFEWARGFTPRFGLVEVDYKTQARKVRPSAGRTPR